MSKISVVVPIYNVEHYIRHCIESLLSQSYKDFELVLIDDGSSDSSIHNLLPLIEGLTNVHIYSQKNSGVSVARNNGIKYASGEWITFVDSDDTVLPDYLEKLANGIHSADFILSRDRYVDNSNIIKEDQLQERFWKKEDGWDDNTILYLENMTSLHGKLFRRDIILNNNICFNPSLRLGEDRDFCVSYLAVITKFHYLSYAGYCYRTDVVGSLSKQRIENLLQTDLVYWNKVHQIVGDACPSYQVNRLFNFLIDNILLLFQRFGLLAAINEMRFTKHLVNPVFLQKYWTLIESPKWMRCLIKFYYL